ncbi:RmlC-like cupin domain-containing protein [Schizophyllum fasciatum]
MHILRTLPVLLATLGAAAPGIAGPRPGAGVQRSGASGMRAAAAIGGPRGADPDYLPPPGPYASTDPNPSLWSPSDPGADPQPVRGGLGASPVLGPTNRPLDLQNPDLLAPPSTDVGDVPNLKWPMSLSHNRLTDGGWARQQTVKDMPAATDLAGVNMHLKAGAIREMHWHTAADVVTPEGHVYLGDVNEGDLWYFPPGIPHSIQAKAIPEDGSEFLLVFDDGNFNEDETFLLTNWLAHVPTEVLAKNFNMRGNTGAFDRIPDHELYIFPGVAPPENPEDDMVVPNDTELPYTFKLSEIAAEQKQGGSVKVVDSKTFKVATAISAAVVEVEVGGMRELHWHPIEPEWTFFLEGEGRMTIFTSSASNTFNYQGGDVAYVPPSFGHYVENTGSTKLKFLEIFKSDVFEDISLSQWLALTPPTLVKAHLGFSDEIIGHLDKVKQEVV